MVLKNTDAAKPSGILLNSTISGVSPSTISYIADSTQKWSHQFLKLEIKNNQLLSGN